MKALFINWGILMMDIPVGLKNIGIEADVYEKDVSILTYVEEEREELCTYLRKKPYDFVITYNFVRSVSDACEEAGVVYASWIFDSPQIDLYTKPAFNKCNFVFCFDKVQTKRMKERGIKNVFYLPLAANVNRVLQLKLNPSDMKKYSADISFVGTLYENNHYNREIGGLVKEEKEYLDKIILDTAMHWGEEYSVFERIDEQMSKKLEKYVLPRADYEIEHPYFYELYYVARKVTEIERVCILNGLAMRTKVDLFTKSDTSALEGVHIHPPVDYNEEAPKVYNLSRINLNITMRTIETGVPQRVFDIMGAGGFCLCNWQKEAEELFEPDKEIVLFKDMEELLAKAHYYLTHEEERLFVALNGWKRVQEEYSYEAALKKLTAVLKRNG